MNISKNNALFRRLWGKATRLSGGTTIDKVIYYAHSTQGGWYDRSSVLNTAEETVTTRAVWNFRYAHQPMVLFNPDIARNGGTEAVFNLVVESARNAERAIQDKFGTALFTKQAGLQMDSLVDAADDGTNTGTYGGIVRGTYSWFKGDYTASAGALSLSVMASTYDNIQSGSDVPTLIVMHKSEFTSYESLLQPQVRYIYQTQGYPKIDGGFNAMQFRGTPIITDEYIPDGHVYYLNEKYLEVVTLAHPEFPTDRLGFTTTKFRSPVDQDGRIGKYNADIKSALIKLGNSVHTILTSIKVFINMVLYEYPQQALQRAVATTERAEFKGFTFGQATV